jgi:prepilin-type N-terminal cleavage/methylation domain-containing protein
MEGQKSLKDMCFKIQDSRFKIQDKVIKHFVVLNFEYLIFNSRKAGFTLLEIMIALAIIGLTLVTVLHTVNYHSRVSYENIVTTHMVQFAKEKMTGIETNPVNFKGAIEGTDLTYETIVSPTDDPGMIKLKTVVKGQGKEVVLNEIVSMGVQ